MNLATDIHAPLRMNSSCFGDRLTFHFNGVIGSKFQFVFIMSITVSQSRYCGFRLLLLLLVSL